MGIAHFCCCFFLSSPSSEQSSAAMIVTSRTLTIMHEKGKEEKKFEVYPTKAEEEQDSYTLWGTHHHSDKHLPCKHVVLGQPPPSPPAKSG